MARTRGLVGVEIRKKDVDDAYKQALLLIKNAGEGAIKAASIKTYHAVESAGTIPVLTGALKSQGHYGVKDKYKDMSYIFGWTMPYARVRYYGVGHESQWSMVNGKRTKTVLGGASGGTPFWDYPVTRNQALMTNIFMKAFKERKEFK